MSVEELMQVWKKSADYGTVVHEELENLDTKYCLCYCKNGKNICSDC